MLLRGQFCVARSVGILVVCLSLRVGAFALGASCLSYGANKDSLVTTLIAAMEEAQDMVRLASEQVTQPPEDAMDNSRAVLFAGGVDADFLEIQGKTSWMSGRGATTAFLCGPSVHLGAEDIAAMHEAPS
jgi:hypothetical protein